MNLNEIEEKEIKDIKNNWHSRRNTMSNFQYEITKHIGTISESPKGWTKN